jgi:hypothetical protein
MGILWACLRAVYGHVPNSTYASFYIALYSYLAIFYSSPKQFFATSLKIKFVKNCFTFACILSPVVTNSAAPFPASAIPLTRADDAPDPMPNEKHLEKKIVNNFQVSFYTERWFEK